MDTRNTVRLACLNDFIGQVFEKYHAQIIGEPGGGGEYIVQEGFGWSNGVILYILKHYGLQLKAPQKCPQFLMEKPLRNDFALNDDQWIWKKQLQPTAQESRHGLLIEDNVSLGVGLAFAASLLFAFMLAAALYALRVSKKKTQRN